MRGNPRLFWGAAAPRPAVVEAARGKAAPAHRRGAQAFSLVTLLLGSAYLIWLGRLVLVSRDPPDIIFLGRRNPVFPPPLPLKLQYLAFSDPPAGKPGIHEPFLRGHLRAVLRRAAGSHQDHSQGRGAD